MIKESSSPSAGPDYAEGKIGRLFQKMFFPTLLGLIFNALITIIDGIFVGHGVGPEGIAAVNISFIGLYQSIEKALRVMIFTLMCGIIVLVPMFCILPSLFPGWGIWAAIPVSEAITLIVICLTAKHSGSQIL